ncbi:hypothetical protein [Trichothermofontia sp.]
MLVARRHDRLQVLQQDLQAGGYPAHTYSANASDPIALTGAIATIQAEVGTPAGDSGWLYNRCGMVSPNDLKYSPDQVAENYWQYHHQPLTECGPEVVY